MIARRYIESARDKARALKWELAKADAPMLSRERLAEKAAWIADYLSELLTVIDDDVFMRSIVSQENSAEVRFTARPSAKEISTLREILAISENTFDRRDNAEVTMNAGVTL